MARSPKTPADLARRFASQRSSGAPEDSPQSDGWRRAVTTHMRVVGSQGEGDHYPWKVYVNQVTGERIVPPTR